jgi:hypothetical protein
MLNLKVLFSLLLLLAALAKPDGAPDGTCREMKPHHNGSQEMETDSPYKIYVKKVDRSTYNLVLRNKKDNGTPFKGFILQARDDNYDSPVGEFFLKGSNAIKFMNCSMAFPMSSITHTNREPKVSVEVDWKAPTGFKGDVVFKATVVQQFNTFWADLEEEVHVNNEAHQVAAPSMVFLLAMALLR